MQNKRGPQKRSAHVLNPVITLLLSFCGTELGGGFFEGVYIYIQPWSVFAYPIVTHNSSFFNLTSRRISVNQDYEFVVKRRRDLSGHSVLRVGWNCNVPTTYIPPWSAAWAQMGKIFVCSGLFFSSRLEQKILVLKTTVTKTVGSRTVYDTNESSAHAARLLSLSLSLYLICMAWRLCIPVECA